MESSERYIVDNICSKKIFKQEAARNLRNPQEIKVCTVDPRVEE
jgi:hypothetical protein